MEIPGSRVDWALIYLDVYREMQDGIPADTLDEGRWRDRMCWEAAVGAVENVLDALGIEHD